MGYLLISLLVFLAVFFIIGTVLIADAGRRLVSGSDDPTRDFSRSRELSRNAQAGSGVSTHILKTYGLARPLRFSICRRRN